ncbi:helix-turn-helix domain-containing protein [Streptomyces beijiangensis]
MGRHLNPLPQGNEARREVAHRLRIYLRVAHLTFQELADRTPGISRVTLQRAASGKCTPKEKTLIAFATSCGRTTEEILGLVQLRVEARIIERGVLRTLSAPRADLISDRRDLSRALEYMYEAAGAPSLREIQDKSGDPLALPTSTISRIVSRTTVPVDGRQLIAFVRGCGITDQDSLWWAVWNKVATAYDEAKLVELALTEKQLDVELFLNPDAQLRKSHFTEIDRRSIRDAFIRNYREGRERDGKYVEGRGRQVAVIGSHQFQ